MGFTVTALLGGTEKQFDLAPLRRSLTKLRVAKSSSIPMSPPPPYILLEGPGWEEPLHQQRAADALRAFKALPWAGGEAVYRHSETGHLDFGHTVSAFRDARLTSVSSPARRQQ